MAIIGAGIIGAAIAETLAARDASVRLFDMRAPGMGASQASAGVLAPYIEAQPDSPLLALGARSLAMFDDFIAGVRERSGMAVEYARTGTLEVALNTEDDARLRHQAVWLEANGIAHEWLTGAALREFEPAASASAFAGLMVPIHGCVGVRGLVCALVQSARLSGAWMESPVEVVRIDPGKDHVEIRVGDRVDHADYVVVASGSWTKRVRIAGLAPLPVKPIRGQLLHLQWGDAAPLPKRAVWGTRCYTVPWSDGSLLVGATVEDVGFDERSTVAGVRDLMDAVGELLPGSWQASLEAVRVGLRPATPDHLPLLGPIGGPLENHSRVIIATGHYRNGILLAPLTAAVVAKLILDGERDPILELTKPERFREQGVRGAG